MLYSEITLKNYWTKTERSDEIINIIYFNIDEEKKIKF